MSGFLRTSVPETFRLVGFARHQFEIALRKSAQEKRNPVAEKYRIHTDVEFIHHIIPQGRSGQFTAAHHKNILSLGILANEIYESRRRLVREDYSLSRPSGLRL